MKKLFPLCCLLLPLFSCTETSHYIENTSHATTIHSPQHLKTLQVAKYSDVFDSVKIIPLESPDSGLIGRIDKILVHNNKIFILDQVQRKSVLEFDMNGKFIRHFGKVGRGPGEYIEPNDMSVNDKEVAIWVNDQRKFITYDLNGNYLREIRTGTLAKSGVQLEREKFALYLDIGGEINTTETFDLKVFNNFGKNTYDAFEKKDKNFSKGAFFFSQFNNSYLVSPGYSNKIYEINAANDTLTEKYNIDFGEYTLPEDYALKYGTLIKFQQGLDKSGYAVLNNYWETPDYLVYTFTYKELIYDVYYSKKTGTLKYGNAWFNNVYGIISGANKGAYDNYVISVFDPAGIASYQKNYTTPRSKTQMDTITAAANKYYGLNSEDEQFVASDFAYTQGEAALLQSIKASDNPILIVKKMKQF